MDEVDLSIPAHLKDILNSLFSGIGTVVVVCYAAPMTAVIIVPLVTVFIFIQNCYLNVSR